MNSRSELEIEYWSRWDDHYERYAAESEDLRRDWEMDNIDWEEEDHWEMVLNDPRSEGLTKNT